MHLLAAFALGLCLVLGGKASPQTQGASRGETPPAAAKRAQSRGGSNSQDGRIASPVAADSFFGLTVLDYEHQHAPLPFGLTRTWDAYPGLDWGEANPAPGRYEFHPLDHYLDLFARDGREVIYTFGRTPRWASTQKDAVGAYGPGECAAPSLSAWDAYVNAVVTHAGGRVHYWELWNEPDQPRFYCGDVSTLVTMAQHAYAIIKRLQPSAVVLSPAATGGSGAGYLARFLQAGGKGTFDAIAFHGYEGVHAEAINAIVAVYRHAMAVFKLPPMPMFDTECSWGGNPIADQNERAAFLAKYFILQRAAHVDHVLWYAYDGDAVWGRLIDARGSLAPDGIAYAQTYKWLTGATLTACAADPQDTWTCSLTRPGGYIAQILWNSGWREPRSLPVPPSMVQRRDLTGKAGPIPGKVSVSNMPVLIESQPLRY